MVCVNFRLSLDRFSKTNFSSGRNDQFGQSIPEMISMSCQSDSQNDQRFVNNLFNYSSYNPTVANPYLQYKHA